MNLINLTDCLEFPITLINIFYPCMWGYLVWKTNATITKGGEIITL